jgi:hypothetical protein
MAGYFVANYTITNEADYKESLAAVGASLQAHGAENIVIDRDSELQDQPGRRCRPRHCPCSAWSATWPKESTSGSSSSWLVSRSPTRTTRTTTRTPTPRTWTPPT